MSHLKERNEKVCLNCNAQLAGPFCHICGQQNIEPKESVWHLLTHFFNDITHFDGKFFSTTGLLIKRPGFLPKEYMVGRRASYLNPIRMYIFTSAVFFLIFFSITHITDKNIDNSIIIDGKTLNEIHSLNDDSLTAFTARVNHGKPIPRENLESYIDSFRHTGGFHFTGNTYKSKEQYDSILKLGIKKHNWFERRLIYTEIGANEKYNNNRSVIITSMLNTFLHSFPQMLFISLPIFALILQLLYLRRKKYYYVSHGIFSIHFYIFTFVVLLLMLALGKLKDWLNWEWINFIRALLNLVILFYLYKAMRNFYQQGRAKTIVKFLLLSLLATFMIAFLFVGFILFSFMKI
ncbi:MAG: DUF3667 domain-containing protein [Ferruginibacter sp.]